MVVTQGGEELEHFELGGHGVDHAPVLGLGHSGVGRCDSGWTRPALRSCCSMILCSCVIFFRNRPMNGSLNIHYAR